jgi:pyridoxal phosphate enzyme (YggS family)
MMMYLEENIKQIRENITAACTRVGSDPSDVLLLAVTKTIDEAIVNESLKFGLTDVAENRVQEIQRKYDNISPGVAWHLIGHLQRNKVKYIIELVDLIHSVDSVRLAEEIDLRAGQAGKVMEILLQLNISHEETKFGVDTTELESMIEEISALEHVHVVGLMTMAPYFDDSEQARGIFRKMKEIFENLKYNENDRIEMKFLSMGMTNDYVVAVEEGANIVRIGTGIYGQRDYSK